MSEHGSKPTPLIPDEVRRLPLEPGDRLIVRSSTFTPVQAREYEEYLRAWFPDNETLVILGDEIAVQAIALKAQPLTANLGGTIGMPESDMDTFAKRIGRQIAQATHQHGGIRVLPGDDPDDGAAGVPARR